MKHGTYAEYDPKGMALTLPGLLTAWAGIQRFSDELVVVGGLVPHYVPLQRTLRPPPKPYGGIKPSQRSP